MRKTPVVMTDMVLATSALLIIADFYLKSAWIK
jgi:hypothetical protein